jgi:hypothetical protein
MGSNMEFDAWESIEFDQNGETLIDAFETWVCSKKCGYYIRQTTSPIQGSVLHLLVKKISLTIL